MIPGYSLAEPIRIVMPSVGGRLRVLFSKKGPRPTIRKSGEPVALWLLAADPSQLATGVFAEDVEPGEYTVCVEQQCESTVIAPSSEVLIDLR